MLEIRLLGELQVMRDGQAVPLPASRKSRALLAYLAATSKPHLRERLCELLWEGPDDPRAALRWSLSKLRPLVEPHLVAGRDRVEYRGEVDVQRLCTPSNATTVALEQCATLFRGEFLDGLDLPSCFRFQQWCAGERERVRQTHVAILTALTERLGDDALPYARRRVMIDPFNDQAHAALIRLLASAGQHHEALRQYEHCCQMFDRELGTRPGPVVEEARRTIGVVPASGRPSKAGETPALHENFVGRSREIAAIESASDVVLILGEPGIGKSRLLEEARARCAGPTIYGRAFAAEMIRPYGIWIDALNDFPSESDRSRLFDAVVERLSGITFIAIDDLQWIDEASAALLHYVARKSTVRIVCAARLGEIDDNTHAKRLVHDLKLLQITLGPLSEEETRALVSDERVVQQSGGNPLFALELARSGVVAGAVTSVIANRLSELEGSAREVVSWAAAVGRQFDAEIVGRATGLPAGDMLAGLEKLERAAIIRAAGDRSYDFTHDLIRDAAYQMITGPRRMLVHRHIARALRETHDPDGILAGEIVHHASLAGDHEAAAVAAVKAGERCLRLFAYAEGISVARRGLQMTSSVDLQIQLLSVVVMSRSPLRERLEIASNLGALTESAARSGLAGAAALGAHLLACLNAESDNGRAAADATIQSAEFSRGADRATSAVAIAGTARCLLHLQRDIARAESLLAEAQAIGIDSSELALGLGYLHAHEGRIEAAELELERGYELAAREQDHWREWLALWRMTTLALEQHNPKLALRHCGRLRAVAAKMTGGSEGVRSEALQNVAQFAAGQPADLDASIARLREVDSKTDLAWVLGYVAGLEVDRGAPELARRHAEEALSAAEAAGRESDAVIARCILGLPVHASRDITAHARKLLKERKHGHTRARAVV